jgi:hypothetical protein
MIVIYVRGSSLKGNILQTSRMANVQLWSTVSSNKPNVQPGKQRRR